MEEILKRLEFLEIPYKLVEHKPVYTIEEINILRKEIFEDACICKTLFLKAQKEKRYILYILRGEKKANLSKVARKIGSSRLSFASEEKLEEYLRIKKGSVTPLAIVFNKESDVEIIIDKDLLFEEKIGIHPGINTATVLISPNGLIRFINFSKNKIMYI